jgi:hypothetical protein
VVVVIWHLVLTRRQLTAAFERGFVNKYERIIERVPLRMLLGEHLDVEQDDKPFVPALTTSSSAKRSSTTPTWTGSRRALGVNGGRASRFT